MDGDTFYTIGELARRTGLPVRTIRFYSDAGLVPPSTRSGGGYRLYDVTAVARLDLVRTLRELDVDLPTVRRVLDHEVDLADVAAAHVRAIDVQIDALRLRRAVLRAVARRRSGPKEMELMHRLAKLSDEERRRLITDFVDATFEGLESAPGFADRMRAAVPELPDDPTPEQVEAWVELAELVQDPGFRASVRRMAEYQHSEMERGDDTGEALRSHNGELMDLVQRRAGAAREAGLAPASPEAAAVVDEVVTGFAAAAGRDDDPAFRAELLERCEIGNDPRTERYWRLLGVINGWPEFPELSPAYSWFVEALRARVG
ncbi:MerR family transcriptional regulator [Actinomadura kijaniata]|uniref:MerR family transcriptional regulator n=1 Tax=Actinomadura kijaniata TaxID=46161 RepID=UPI00082DB57B|nr:MerR family transcriptional regulator [Actinomadura kijaniata]